MTQHLAQKNDVPNGIPYGRYCIRAYIVTVKAMVYAIRIANDEVVVVTTYFGRKRPVLVIVE